jgi:hypothetical protein
MEKKEELPNKNSSSYFICSVKNCREKILKGEEIVINNQIFCRQCSIMIYRQAIGGSDD